MRKKYICTTCKGDNVKIDAFASWDTENQCWELAATFDNAFCDDCQGETAIEEIEIPRIVMAESLGMMKG